MLRTGGDRSREGAKVAEIVVRRRGEGKALWALNGLYDLKVTSNESDGALTVGELIIPAGRGPPPHTHPGGEAVYVLEGRLPDRRRDGRGRSRRLLLLPCGDLGEL